MSKRIFNFSAGPAVLPEPVLRKAQEAIWDAEGSGSLLSGRDDGVGLSRREWHLVSPVTWHLE